jgi:hypothetical protein
MVAPAGGPSKNSSSRYPTIGRSEVSNARTPNNEMIQLQTIMESIQRMEPEGSPLVALAQQGPEVVNIIVVQRSAGNPRGNHPSATNQMIRERGPKVRQHHRQAATTI